MKNARLLWKLVTEFWFAPGDVVLRYHEAVIWHAIQLSRPILDIGCGDGKITQHIFSHLLPLEVGLDPEPTGAVESGSYKRVVTAPASAMPVRDASYSTVTSNSTFEHITDDIESIAEISRVLKEGGRLYLTVPHPSLSQLIRKRTDSVEQYVAVHQRIMHLHYRPPSEWQTILRQAGMQVVEHKRYLSPQAGWLWFTLFSLVTWRPHKRELWSYLSQKRFNRFMPILLIKIVEFILISGVSGRIWDRNGVWQYIVAEKVKK